MKVIHLFLEDEEFERLKKIKEREKIKSWHDFFMIMLDYENTK